jgi:hypothetical protein
MENLHFWKCVFFIEGKKIKIVMVVIEWIYGDVYKRIFGQLPLKKKEI